jgi:hypothetical protein
VKSNSISLLNELTVYSQSQRRSCNLDISMLPVFEETQDIISEEEIEVDEIYDSKLSIFKTVAPTHDYQHGFSNNLSASNFFLHGLKGSNHQPSLLSGEKSWNYTRSTGNETNPESELNSNPQSLVDKEDFR